jgi:hypothetical protein
MRKLITALFILGLAVSTSSYAQWTQYRDQNGQPAGTSFTSGGTTQYRDVDGSPSGRTYSSNGVTQAYGRDGAPAGSARSGDSNQSPAIVPSSVYVPYGSPQGASGRQY